MVVLRLGGVYADVDTECTRPLDQLLQPHDAMLVSWENEFATAEEASKRQYVRKRQVRPFYGIYSNSVSATCLNACPLSSIRCHILLACLLIGSDICHLCLLA